MTHNMFSKVVTAGMKRGDVNQEDAIEMHFYTVTLRVDFNLSLPR